MFVIEHRNDLAVFLKRVRDLLKELLSRIEVLPEFVARIITVLTDTQNAVDRNSVCPNRDRTFNCFKDRDVVLFCQLASELCFDRLIDV